MLPTILTTEPASDASIELTLPDAYSVPYGNELPSTRSNLVGTTGLVLPIATASIALHLILVSWFGGGVPRPPTRIVHDAATPVAPIVVENVQLQPEPPPPEPPPRIEEQTPLPEAPSPASNLDLPRLPQVQPIAAVPSSVPVAFGIEVKGPVRLVSDAADASGAIGGRRNTEPIALDLEGEHNLLLPAISYPPRAKRQHLTGTVLIEFRTSPTGEISSVRVRESSGHAILDQAAQDNLRTGRWKGLPGFYVKAFEFTLQ